MDTQQKVEVREANLLELFHVVAKRKMFIIKVCAVVAVASAGYAFYLPNMYLATAKVLPPQKETSGGLSALLGQMGGLANLAGTLGGLGGGSDLYVGILKSRSVRDGVIRRLDLQKVYETATPDDTRRVLEKTVKVQAGKDGIITITAVDKDPKRAADLANVLVDELGRTTVRLNLTKAGTERSFLEKRLELVKKDLKAAEENLKDFSQSNKVVQVDSQARAAIESVARMRAELAAKEVQLSVLRSKQTDESAEVQAMQAGVSRLRSEVGRLTGSSGFAQGVPSVGSVPGVGLEYLRRVRELKTQEAIFEQLTKQYEMAKLSEAKDSSTLQILDEAVVPRKKAKPLRRLIVMLSTVTAFFVSLFFVFVQEYLEKMPEDERNLLKKIRKQALTLKGGTAS